MFGNKKQKTVSPLVAFLEKNIDNPIIQKALSDAQARVAFETEKQKLITTPPDYRVIEAMIQQAAPGVVVEYIFQNGDKMQIRRKTGEEIMRDQLSVNYDIYDNLGGRRR
jgi:hypothetical protein